MPVSLAYRPLLPKAPAVTKDVREALDCMEFMPLTLKPLENPNHDPGQHQVLDAETAYVFKIGGSRERAERIVATLNAAYALSHAPPQPAQAPAVTKEPFYGATCPAYPNCQGGCGLGCRHEIEQARFRERQTVTIFVPDGYRNADEFLKDCHFEPVTPAQPQAPTVTKDGSK